MIASLKPNPWYSPCNWKAHGLEWCFDYNEYAAKRTITAPGFTLSVPIIDTARFPSPQAWLEAWAKKNKKRLPMVEKKVITAALDFTRGYQEERPGVGEKLKRGYKVGDRLQIKNHPDAGSFYQIKEVKPQGWVLTTDNHLFHEEFFEKCSDIVTCSPGLLGSPLQPNKSGKSKRRSLSKSTPTLKPCCARTTQLSLFTQTSETIIPPQESLTSLPAGSLAQAQVTLANEKDSNILTPHSGDTGLESAPPSGPSFSSPSSLLELSDEDFEQSLGDSEWSDILGNLESLERQIWERVMKDPVCLSFPTLTSGDRTLTSRPPGQTKCEKWFKDKGLILPGQQLSAEVMATIQGFPPNWLAPLSPPTALVESEADTSQEERLHRDKRRSHSAEFSICPSCQLPEDLLGDKSPATGDEEISTLKTRRRKGQGSGSIYQRNYKLKDKSTGLVIKEYPQYYYHYEIWSQGDRLKKSTVYISEKLIGKVRELEEEKAPVREILKLLGVIK